MERKSVEHSPIWVSRNDQIPMHSNKENVHAKHGHLTYYSLVHIFKLVVWDTLEL
jgi:hypothetical protein